MHIAICDDNIADRKHLERLLDRESDQRKNETGVFYISSFGSPEVLSKSPMQYDLFFIDLIDENRSGLQFAMELIQIGVSAPIVLCSSAMDYRAPAEQDTPSSPSPSNLFHISKPIKTAALSSLLDDRIRHQARVSTVELRRENETIYLPVGEIICGCANGRSVDIFLADGRKVAAPDFLENFYGQIAMHPQFYLTSRKAFINLHYVTALSLFKVTLTNGTTLSVTPEFRPWIKKGLRFIKNQES